MMRKILVLLTPLALMGCATTSLYAPKTACSDLVEDIYTEPVPDAPAPMEGSTGLDTLKSWITFGVSQTAAKQTEYERAQEARGIIKRCEERDREAIEKSQKKGLFGLRD